MNSSSLLEIAVFFSTHRAGWLKALLKPRLALAPFFFGMIILFSAQSAFAACTVPARAEGIIVYNADFKTLQYCDGTNWIAMHAPGSGSGGCSDPARAEGKAIFNEDYRVAQVCAGNVWRAMGPIGGGPGQFSMLSAASSHTCGIKNDGSLWCWGSDSGGQLGNGATTSDQLSPVAVSGGGTWKYIETTSASASCGIKSDDTLWCWGSDLNGQLGGPGANQDVPVEVSGSATWKSAAGGYYFVCGIQSDDTLWCWGDDAYGQLANGGGTTADQYAPFAVPGGDTWKSVSSGYYFACGIKSDDTLWCWGRDNNAQLGNGATTSNQTSPVTVSGGGTWKSVSTGRDSACGIKSDDTLWCWGGGGNDIPTVISGGGTWKSVNRGRDHACAIKSDDSLWCWGTNTYGQLGDGTTANSSPPKAVFTGDTWLSVTAGSYYTCGIQSDGGRWCWGRNDRGQLGVSGVDGNKDIPTPVTGNDTWNDMSVGGNNFSCGIKNDSTAWCWGYGANGKLGNGGAGSRNVPVEVSGSSTWKKVATASSYGRHACGIKSDNTAWCWGSDWNGQLGNGAATTSNQYAPVAVSGGSTWKDISAGRHYQNGDVSCGIKSDDTAWCWGYDGNGQLGNGVVTTGDQDEPVIVSGGSTWKMISVGSRHVCGIKNDDTAWCWGLDSNDQLGNGAATADEDEPVTVSGGGTWKYISAGLSGTCGVKTDDTLWCWGGSNDVPTLSALGGTWDMVTVGGYVSHNCGIKTNGALWCWGNNQNGQLGLGGQTAPAEVYGGGSWKTVSVTGYHSCGIKSDNTAWCWGGNIYGQLGLGLLDYTTVGVLGDCSSPAGAAAALRYNADYNLVQYCDGGGWVGIGK